jgi:hypothetical protein
VSLPSSASIMTATEVKGLAVGSLVPALIAPPNTPDNSSLPPSRGHAGEESAQRPSGRGASDRRGPGRDTQHLRRAFRVALRSKRQTSNSEEPGTMLICRLRRFSPGHRWELLGPPRIGVASSRQGTCSCSEVARAFNGSLPRTGNGARHGQGDQGGGRRSRGSRRGRGRRSQRGRRSVKRAGGRHISQQRP